MASHSESRLVPYTAETMYAVVADMEKYPQFLPWCTGLKILSRESQNVLRVDMQVGFGGLHESYTSRVTLNPQARTIDITQVHGPFRVLDTHWRFTPTEGGSRVDFSISFDFKSRLLNAVAGAAFERVLFKMTEAFEGRARVLSRNRV
ncbi:MAG: type II toxin-antitoxin system RatA family toxin [Alphaproteobacteria bacterium]|nr:type II toxin-antitoxin system RatA family toxin [Alphaproteobacteria bacterium]